jgi:hypothetical protein
MVISQLLVTFGSQVTVNVAELDSIDQLWLTLLENQLSGPRQLCNYQTRTGV